MAEEFEDRDLQSAVFWNVDLTGARFRDVNLTGVDISNALVVDVNIDAFVERVVINGVDVTPYVNEHDRWYPLRAMLRPTDADGMRAAWLALEREWSATIEQAKRYTDAQLRQSVGGEWSFVQTIRHLVFAMDKWFTAPILGEGFDPMGLPNTGSKDFGWPGLDRDADPTLEEVLALRAQRTRRLRDYLADLAAADLGREVDVLENGPHPINQCLHVVFEEEFAHNRYALRDLAQLSD